MMMSFGIVLVANRVLFQEDREWGEDAGRVADGERKELGEATKVNGGGGCCTKDWVQRQFHISTISFSV